MSPPVIRSTTRYLRAISTTVPAPGKPSLQVFGILKAVSEIAQERMVQLFEHAAFAYDISHALGSHDWQGG